MSAYRRYYPDWRRLEAEMEISRRVAAERDYELSRRIEFDRYLSFHWLRLEREREYMILKDAEKLRAEREYE